ncbi:MAG: alpha/beta hydrolase-fold protein [Solirubrobacteraceae bacterium]
MRRWTQSRFDVALPADRTAVFGVSASGELALAMGLRHPDIYRAVFCASPGAGYRPPAVVPSSLPRAYLVAGMQEPFFLENATRWADAPRRAAADVVMTERWDLLPVTDDGRLTLPLREACPFVGASPLADAATSRG